MTTKADAEAAQATRPHHVLLDTNTLMRLLILSFAVGEKFGVFAAATRAEVRVTLGPFQEAEFWRNAPSVLDEHIKHWTTAAKEARNRGDDIYRRVRALCAIGLCDAATVEAAKQLKRSTDGVADPTRTWNGFESYAEVQFRYLRREREPSYDHDRIRRAAEDRARLFNPPCRDSKPRPVADCSLWECALTLLEQGAVVWFATTDTDFSHPGDVHQLHPFLAREVRQRKGRLEFFHENRNMALQFPEERFKVLDRLLELIPPGDLEQIRRSIDAVAAIVPGASWEETFAALELLPFRERELLKLRLALGDGYQYTQADVGKIFRISQPRVSQLEQGARRLLERAIDGMRTGHTDGVS